jgi:lipooligosaccharide transport system permease protein
MLFFSGVFFPLDAFPGWMKILARFLPLTHAVELSRAVFSGEHPPGLALNLLYLLLLSAAAFFIALRLMKRRLIK